MISDIRSGIPVPPARRPGESKYGFGEMKVGDSRVTDAKPAAVREAIRAWCRTHGGRFTTRVMPNGNTGYWRER